MPWVRNATLRRIHNEAYDQGLREGLRIATKKTKLVYKECLDALDIEVSERPISYQIEEARSDEIAYDEGPKFSGHGFYYYRIKPVGSVFYFMPRHEAYVGLGKDKKEILEHWREKEIEDPDY